VVAELTLQAVALGSPKAARLLSPEITGAIPDPVLGARGNPLYPEHDATGYRNRDRPDHAAIVVLGDSHAYGVSVRRDEAWPHLLESSLGARVYSMAMPGYCPVENLLQFDEALSFRPQRIIVSVYFGNDFFDAFTFSMRNASVSAAVPPQLARESKVLEAKRALRKDVDVLSSAGESAPDGDLFVAGVREWLANHSRLYGLARATWRVAVPAAAPATIGAVDFETLVRTIPPSRLRYWTIADRPKWRSILTPSYRGLVVDDRDPRIRLGVEVVKSALKSMADRSREADIEFLVALLPTKEAVFWPHTDQTHQTLADLVANETRLKIELTRDLTSYGVDVVDVTEPLREAGSQPYFESQDGHPNALGHRLIAAVIRGHLAGEPRTSPNPGETFRGPHTIESRPSS